MNTIDIACLVVIGLFSLIGIWRGLIHSIFRLFAWVFAIVGAYFANGLLSESIISLLDCSKFSSSIVSTCVGFLVPFILFSLIGHLVSKAISETAVGRANRILGGVFGAIKAMLICFVLLSILHVMPFGKSIQTARDDAISYSLYKFSLATMGYSTDPIDLVGVAEKKASEFTKSMADKASEKANEVKQSATDAAKEAVTDAAKKAAAEAKESVSNAANSLIK